MTTAQRFGWFVIAGFVVAGLLASCLARANAAPPSTLVDRLVRAQASVVSRTDPPVDALEFAQAVVAVPKVTREWAALLLTVAGHESGLSARIARGDCRSFECDGGRAWGLWQGHKNAHNREQWGSPDVRVQALSAAGTLRRAFYTCQRGGKLRPDWVRRTINAYAGRACEAAWPGLEARLATFNRLAARL